MEVIHSSETTALTRVTRRHIPIGDILHIFLMNDPFGSGSSPVGTIYLRGKQAAVSHGSRSVTPTDEQLLASQEATGYFPNTSQELPLLQVGGGN
jgi:hypothetical protein